MFAAAGAKMAAEFATHSPWLLSATDPRPSAAGAGAAAAAGATVPPPAGARCGRMAWAPAGGRGRKTWGGRLASAGLWRGSLLCPLLLTALPTLASLPPPPPPLCSNTTGRPPGSFEGWRPWPNPPSTLRSQVGAGNRGIPATEVAVLEAQRPRFGLPPCPPAKVPAAAPATIPACPASPPAALQRH